MDLGFTDYSLLYASISTGYKGGGLNPGNSNTPVFDPETVNAFEVGMKNNLLGNAVQANLATFEDFDLEVYALEPDALRAALAAVGRVDAVGQAFGVLKVSGLAGVAGCVDVSLPRRDSKAGPGHRGIAVSGDPHLSIAEASRRRDFTINAMLLDPFTGALEDPWSGRADLAARVLRAVDPRGFGDDPLRALRAVQLAARYELRVDPDTARLCAAMPIRELPPERVLGEIEKLLLKAARPSIGLALLHPAGDPRCCRWRPFE